MAKKKNGIVTKESLAFFGLNEYVILSITSEWIDIIESPYWLQLDRTHEFVEELFKHSHGRELALLTARRHVHWLYQELCRLRIASFFSHIEVVSPNNAAEEKAFFLREYKPDLFVGDTVSDALAARKARIPFCAVTWGQHDRAHLIRESRFILDNPSELVALCVGSHPKFTEKRLHNLHDR